MENIELTCGNCALFADEDTNGDGWCEYHQMPTNCSDTTNQLENNLQDCFLPKNYDIKDIKVAHYQSNNPDTWFITWNAHLKAYQKYAQRYGTSQSAERINERGGFGEEELDDFYPEWRNYIVRTTKN